MKIITRTSHHRAQRASTPSLLRAVALIMWLLSATESQAKDAPAETKEACVAQKVEQGVAEKIGAVECAIKQVFRSRVRRRAATEPVEMVVASPPMQSDDTGTPGPGVWEVNLALNGDFAGSEHRIEGPLVDLNYGIGDAVQIKYEVPYVFQATTDDDGNTVRQRGVGDSLFGVKYRFYDNRDTGLALAIYPQVQFRTPGAPARVSANATTYILPLLVTCEFEHAALTGNLGVELTAGERRYFASAGVGTRLSDRLALLGEMVGKNLNASDEKQVLANIGLVRKLADNRSISGSIGTDVYAGGDQARHRYISIAFQQLFGK